jgi:hypothetical protein
MPARNQAALSLSFNFEKRILLRNYRAGVAQVGDDVCFYRLDYLLTHLLAFVPAIVYDLLKC